MEQEAAIKKHMSRNFSCTRCKFSTAWERNLRKHMNHGREKLLCQTCPVRFLQKKKVTHFVRHNSETLTKLSCKECDFTNLRKNKLTLSYKHKTHTEAAPFQNEPVQWRWRSPLKRGSQNALDCFSDGDTQLPHHPPLLLLPLPPRPAQPQRYRGCPLRSSSPSSTTDPWEISTSATFYSDDKVQLVDVL